MDQYAGSGGAGPGYDVLPDGRFVMVRTPGPDAARELVVVQHFFEEARRLTGSR